MDDSFKLSSFQFTQDFSLHTKVPIENSELHRSCIDYTLPNFENCLGIVMGDSKQLLLQYSFTITLYIFFVGNLLVKFRLILFVTERFQRFFFHLDKAKRMP